MDLTIEEKYNLVVGTALVCDPPDDPYDGYIASPWESLIKLKRERDEWQAAHGTQKKANKTLSDELDKRYYLSTKDLIERIEGFKIRDFNCRSSVPQYDEGYNQALQDIIDGIRGGPIK